MVMKLIRLTGDYPENKAELRNKNDPGYAKSTKEHEVSRRNKN